MLRQNPKLSMESFTDESIIRARIVDALTNKEVGDYESTKKCKDYPFIGEICKGDERWVRVHISSATVEHLGDLAYNLTIPYNGNYDRKHFTGAGANYEREQKNCSGELKCKMTVLPGGKIIENVELVNPDPSEAHDSTRMCKEAIITYLDTLVFI
ncbi:hypothetical protein MOC97_08010 [Bacillus atrophaeus]|uniref:hypothetical protein n=1 Tax=Bacillus atrophaeus TaxID=1452 RepID=UPI002280D1B0|nr:hypothetical protein [Bacillus atrophaeus]MCY8485430.1 hypothetical protein [Bacillus atrophaeus]